LNLLRDLDSDWSYETCEEYLDDASTLLDENTKHLLNTAIINPEVQIDFMDFLASIRVQDKITLLNSFAEDFSSDALANILIPVFVSDPDSPAGKEALKLLGNTKSQLALNILEKMQNMVQGELAQEVKRSLSTIKISGVREDNTKEFYKKILSNSKPDKFYITYPDGHGDMAMIFTRLTQEKNIRFVSIVINVSSGIKDCFGFYEISQFECDKILEKFLRNEKAVSVTPETFKTILYNAEITTSDKSSWKLPYEYVCWKNLLLDIDFDSEKIEQILKEQVITQDIDASIFKRLTDMKISSHWFLDCQYSDEFVNALSQLKNENNLDEFIEREVKHIFNDEEKAEWTKKILTCAYIKFAIGKDSEAQEIYSLAKNSVLLDEMYKNILKRSIYEYLTLIKFDKNIERYGLTNEEIDNDLDYINKKWVTNV
jgi:hypothetical protein